MTADALAYAEAGPCEAMRSSIRVLYFLNSPGVPGGVEEHVYGLVQHLPALGFEVSLVCPTACYGYFAPLAGLSRHVFSLDLYALTHRRAMLELVRILRTQRIQVAHSHQFVATAFLAPLAWMAGVPSIVETAHVREAWRRSWLKRSFLVDRLVYTLVDRFVAVSRANARYLVEQKRCSAERVVQIYNGRDMTAFEPSEELGRRTRAEFGIAPMERLLVVVGRLAPQKGHRFILEALPAIRARIPHITVLFVGDGELRGALEAEVLERGLGRCVIFTGFQTAVARFLAAADLVVLPSLFEGFPLVPIETAAMGKAIVATAVDGTPEVVLDGETGLLVPPGDAGCLAEAITTLLRDDARRRTMGAVARRFVRDRFTVERQAAAHADLYRSLVDRRTAGGRVAVGGG